MSVMFAALVFLNVYFGLQDELPTHQSLPVAMQIQQPSVTLYRWHLVNSRNVASVIQLRLQNSVG